MNEGLEGVGDFFEDGPTPEECKARFCGGMGMMRMQGFMLLHFFAARYPNTAACRPHIVPIIGWLLGSPHYEDANAICAADGCPPLRHAVQARNYAMVDALIRTGANVHKVSSLYDYQTNEQSGQTTAVETALDLYMDGGGERQIVLLLLDAGAEATRKPSKQPHYVYAFKAHKQSIRTTCILLLALWKSGQSPLLRTYTDRNTMLMVVRSLWALRFDL